MGKWGIGIVSEKELREFVRGRKEQVAECLTVIAKTSNGKVVVGYRRGLKCVKVLKGLNLTSVGDGFIIAEDDRFNFSPLKTKLKRLGKEEFLSLYGDIPILIRNYRGVVYDLRSYTVKRLLSKHRKRKGGDSSEGTSV